MSLKARNIHNQQITESVQNLAILSKDSEKRRGSVNLGSNLTDLERSSAGSRLENVVDSVERSVKQSQRDTDQSVKEVQQELRRNSRELDQSIKAIQREVDSKIQKAMDNPLAKCN